MKKYYFKQTHGINYLTTYSMDSTYADLLIFGSSRANRHYNPMIFEENTKLDCYNVGRDGQSIFYYVAVQRSILKRYKPKAIILDLTPSDIEYINIDYERISSIFPYYSEKKYLHDLIFIKSDLEKIKFISKIYPFNSFLLSIIAGNIKDFNPKSHYKGYRPLFTEYNNKNNPGVYNNNYDLDSTKIFYLKEFINNCKSNNTDLTIIISPYLTIIKNNIALQFLEELADENQITFLDYSNNYFFKQNPSLFADEGHLNDNGASIFSNIILHIKDLQHFNSDAK